MSATPSTTDIRARRTAAETIKRLAEQHGRAQGDVVEAMAQLAEAQPAAFTVMLAAVEPFRAAAGLGRQFGEKARVRPPIYRAPKKKRQGPLT